MKAVTLSLLLATLYLLVVSVRAECGDAPKESDEGDVKTWFKNIGCKIQKGAEDLGESAKPWADKIGASAKDFGQNVAQKYDAIKHKLTDENVTPSSTQYAPVIDGPTEKVPLAPLSGDNAADIPISETPKSIDDRFVFQPYECPIGQLKDKNNRCRPKA